MNLSVSSRHQVCSSPFVTDEWIETLLLPDPQSNYSSTEFKKIAFSTFQLLGSLCQLSEEYLTDEISDLMSRSFINSHVVSRRQLDEHIESIINQFKLNTPTSFLITLQLVRAMIGNNTLMSVLETNWQWIAPNYRHRNGKMLHTKPVVYNGSCNCGLSSECVEESMFPGLMTGCYPLESLLKSTLECLYNVSCFPLLQSISRSFAPLNESIPSQYQENSTVESILNQLMVEEWISNVTYENYYAHCAPSLCSYSYIERRPALDVSALVLELYGGLVIIVSVFIILLATVWQEILIKRQHDHQTRPVTSKCKN
jgi:hypothetical protein